MVGLITISKADIKILNEAQGISLDTDSDISKVSSLMLEYIKRVYAPFWTKYSALQTVNDEVIDIVPDDQITDYIPSYASFKKLIIMKLCKNSKYEEYRDWLYSGLKKRYEDGRNENYYRLLLDLVKILETDV